MKKDCNSDNLQVHSRFKKKKKSAIEKNSLHNSISLPLEITSHNIDLSWNIFSQRQDSPFHKSTYQDSFMSGSLLV